ncbi:MAG: DNA repair and recombination protein RadA [Thermofilaceae archaeon]|nr:DNA repair and recombination protein RadA [Thermofilaceae archaeon]MCX8180172.1 DNA repair and recombination protein RadA [Thermofilaceae archaeon]MDW8004172.1 DNA repair and recombination protein RadA [Thermofilaceae archaeon]
MRGEHTPVKEMKVSGVGKLTLEKVSEVVEYVEDLALFNPEELAERAEIELDKAVALVRAARKLVKAKLGIRRAYKGSEYARILESRDALTSGVETIDELLGGGMFIWDIYEFAGEFGTGKTQLCHQLAVTVQLPPALGGLAGKAVYIDTEGTFSPQRVEAVAGRVEVAKPLENIYVVRPMNVDELEETVIEDLPSLLRDNARLIVVDSIIALYRAEFKGREMLAARQQRINYLLDWLKRYARHYNAVVAITNQVLSQPVPWGVAMKIPAGGNIIAHASTHRLVMRRAGDVWVVEVFDSPTIPRGAAARFVITEKGLEKA